MLGEYLSRPCIFVFPTRGVLLAACRASIRVIRLVQASSRVEVKSPSQDVSQDPRAPGLEPAAKRGNRGEAGM